MEWADIQHAAGKTAPSNGPEEGQWNCVACTLENEAFDVLCDDSVWDTETPRPVDLSKMQLKEPMYRDRMYSLWATLTE